MSYITEEEISTYCGLTAGVTMDHVAAASALIDAYKGVSLAPQKRTERVSLSMKRATGESRGKLVHYPRVSIDKVSAKTRTPFGVSEVSLPVSSIEFDSGDSVYFSFYMPRQLMFHRVPQDLRVEYTSGYTEVPEEIKRACGILACNIMQMGGILRWKSRDDYDIKVTLGNDGVMTEEVRKMLDGVVVQ